MMTSPDWTRAIFVRDPKERFLSAFMDKALQYPQFIRSKCCKETKDCDKGVKMPLGFLNLIQTCHNDHWSQQHYRVEQKFWPYINFVGNFETQQQDAKRLLQQIGAWDVYGKSGWGKSGDLEIFQKATNTQKHVTNSKSKASQWFTPELERMVETYYEVDYLNPKFNFVTTNLTGGNDSRERNAGYLLKDVFQKLLDQGRSIDFQKLIPK